MDADAFLVRFFGEGNGVTWGHIPPDLNQWLQPWFDRVRTRRFPVLLPRLTVEREMRWYAVAASPSSADELYELILAFIAPTFGRVSREMRTLDAKDPVEAAVKEYLGDAVYTVDVPRTEDAPAVRESWTLLRGLLEARPESTRTIPRAIGRILRDFELALAGCDFDLADEFLAELRVRGTLTAANLSFLEVARSAASADWQGVLSHPNLGRLLEIRRPARVTAALAESIWRVHFAEYEPAADVDAAVSHLNQVVMPQFGSFFDGLSPVSEFAARLLLLRAVEVPEIWPGLVAGVASLGDPLTAALVSRMPSPAPPVGEGDDPIRSARDLVARGEMAVAFAELVGLPDSAARAALLVECAFELNTLAAAAVACEAVDRLDVALPTTRRFTTLLDALRAMVLVHGHETVVPRSWVEWLQLTQLPEASAHLNRWAEAGLAEWPESDLRDRDAIRQISELFGTGTDDAVTAHLEALPLLMQALERATAEDARPVYRQFFDTLLYRGTRTRAELNLLLDVLEVTLGDFTDAEYRHHLSNLGDLWNEVQSVATLPWALDLLDLVTVQPGQDKNAREQLATSVLATCRAFEHRIEPSLIEAFNDVVLDLGLSEELAIQAPDGAGGEDLLARLKGLRVAIYTLSESAAIRIRDRLGAFTGRSVTVHSDKVCTEGLREAAADADLFIMVTRSAKHAATDCIKRHRAAGKPLVQTAGKGSSSALYAVRQYLATIDAG